MLTGWRVGFLEPYAMQGSIARHIWRGPLVTALRKLAMQPRRPSFCSALWFLLLAFPCRFRFTRGRSPRLVCFFTSPPLNPRFSSRNKQRNLNSYCRRGGRLPGRRNGVKIHAGGPLLADTEAGCLQAISALTRICWCDHLSRCHCRWGSLVACPH
ncbi:hypothetical protein J3F84DRAFT_13292 [Trichoderma pleuroticola]